MSVKLMVSALEPSANLHLRPILEHLDSCELCGIFDKSLGDPIYDSSKFGVMGFVDVAGKIFLAKKAIARLVSMSFEVDVVLLVDSPAFNIPLAKAIRKSNIRVKIIYYILPKVWAWKPHRAKEVEHYCDEVCSIFPFEDRFYERMTYVGNPLLDELKIGKDITKKSGKIAFMAGSRRGEIKQLLPTYKEIVKEISQTPVLVVPSFFKGQDLREIYGDIEEFELSFSTQDALLECDFAYICSGTATLEAAIIGIPFVLVYRARWIDYFIAKRFVKLSYVGLANIILTFLGKEPLHRELLQGDVTVENLLHVYKNHKKEQFVQKSKELRDLLKHGAAKNIANIIKNSPIV